MKTPTEIAREAAEQIIPLPFGPPEHLERIADSRKRKVEQTAAEILKAAREIVESTGAREALESCKAQPIDDIYHSLSFDRIKVRESLAKLDALRTEGSK